MNNELKIDPKLMPSVIAGIKKATIRNGRRNISSGPGLLINSSTPEIKFKINISRVEFLRLKDVTREMLDNEGYGALYELWTALLEYYPGIDLESEVTYIEFELDNKSSCVVTNKELPEELRAGVTFVHSHKVNESLLRENEEQPNNVIDDGVRTLCDKIESLEIEVSKLREGHSILEQENSKLESENENLKIENRHLKENREEVFLGIGSKKDLETVEKAIEAFREAKDLMTKYLDKNPKAIEWLNKYCGKEK